ncbi:MAG TPA: hypothetical protein VJN62_05915 [Gemmatimonadales bacterium]|nr:hypothetical protein [Gemmatimonadales bacterium]
MNFLRILAVGGAILLWTPGLVGQTSPDTLMTLGPVRVVVKEETWESPGPPALYFEATTVANYGCLGFGIADTLERSGNTVHWTAYGVAPPSGFCPDAIGPARRTRRLALAPGIYAFRMSYRRRSATLSLRVTDSSVALTARDTTFFVPDQRLWWRFPPSSFALQCENMEYAASACAEFRAWLGRQPGISPYAFAAGGISPYAPEPERTPDRSVALFRYRADSDMIRVRQCLGEVRGRIRRMTGVYLNVRVWTGNDLDAPSSGSGPTARSPKTVTNGHLCHDPGTPDPDTMPRLPSAPYQMYAAILTWVAADQKAGRLLLHDMVQGYGGRPPHPEPSYFTLRTDSVRAPVPVTFLGDSVDSNLDWRALNRGAPRVIGVLRLYRPAFSADSTEATGWLENRCAPTDCGGIREFQFTMDDEGRWTITKVVMRVYY